MDDGLTTLDEQLGRVLSEDGALSCAEAYLGENLKAQGFSAEKGNQYDWGNGPCLLLALAISKWLGTEKVFIAEDAFMGNHVYAQVLDFYIDARGILSRAEMADSGQDLSQEHLSVKELYSPINPIRAEWSYTLTPSEENTQVLNPLVKHLQNNIDKRKFLRVLEGQSLSL